MYTLFREISFKTGSFLNHYIRFSHQLICCSYNICDLLGILQKSLEVMNTSAMLKKE